MGLHQSKNKNTQKTKTTTKNFCIGKETSNGKEKTTSQMGENICKPYIW